MVPPAYLTKYNAEAGEGSAPFMGTFANVTKAIGDFENDDGTKDRWCSAIKTCSSTVLAGRDYSLFGTVPMISSATNTLVEPWAMIISVFL